MNTLSNCKIKEFSAHKEEDEVLIFPLSCFEVISIEKKSDKIEKYYKITLKYLGRYGNLIKNKLGEDFFKEIKNTEYSEDLIKMKLIKNKDFVSS